MSDDGPTTVVVRESRSLDEEQREALRSGVRRETASGREHASRPEDAPPEETGRRPRDVLTPPTDAEIEIEYHAIPSDQRDQITRELVDAVTEGLEAGGPGAAGRPTGGGRDGGSGEEAAGGRERPGSEEAVPEERRGGHPRLGEVLWELSRAYRARTGEQSLDPGSAGPRPGYYGTLADEDAVLEGAGADAQPPLLWILTGFSGETLEEFEWDAAFASLASVSPSRDEARPAPSVGPMQLDLGEGYVLGAATGEVDRDRIREELSEALRSAEEERKEGELTAGELESLSERVDLAVEALFRELPSDARTVSLTGPGDLETSVLLPESDYYPIGFEVGPYYIPPGTGEEEGTGGTGGAGAGGTGEETTDGGVGGEGEGRGRGGEGEGDGSAPPAPFPLEAEGEEGEGEPVAPPWPGEPGEDAEQVTCEPFLGEPPLDELLTGGAALRRQIRRVAFLLRVRPCDFAGTFTHNAVGLVESLSHQIGMSATRDPTRSEVEVTASGDGNHGLVDIHPVQTEALRAMKRIARVVPEIDALFHLVWSTYSDPANRGLVHVDEERERAPDVSGWLYRFTVRYTQPLVSACMFLFAETCRIILLQQLRSSSAFIAERRNHPERTRSDFFAALGILGESVVHLLGLKRMLRRARLGPALGPGLPGGPGGLAVQGAAGLGMALAGPATVDDVFAEADDWFTALSEAEPELLAPLESAEVIERDEGFAVRWRGRTYTDEDLDREIATRRAVLNTVDPLFLQVSDLEPLFHDFSRDPKEAADFLDELLEDMAEANGEVWEETEDEEDGAFFAVEATRYVVAEGGVNARGMRYDMHGLHELADDELRDELHDFELYRQGVVRAIGREEAFDRLVTVLSSAGAIVLGIICAPAGAAVAAGAAGAYGIGLTTIDYLRAQEREELYRSLEDPEAVLSWQEVEAEYLMVGLSAAFSVLDVFAVGRAIRAGASAVKGALRGGGRRGAAEAAEAEIEAAARSALDAEARRGVHAALRDTASGILEGALAHALREATMEAVMSAVLPEIIGPLIEPILARSAIEHGSGVDVGSLFGEPGDAAGAPGGEDVEEILAIHAELTRLEGRGEELRPPGAGTREASREGGPPPDAPSLPGQGRVE